jgi:hypothetical protein
MEDSMDNTASLLILLSLSLWLFLAAIIYDHLASRDDDADAVVPAMSSAFFVVIALWGAYLALVQPRVVRGALPISPTGEASGIAAQLGANFDEHQRALPFDF